jgi:hypothetical protein
MRKLVSAIALTALLGASASTEAWWGWPFGGWGPWGNGWDNGWFGDGWFDFNLSFGAGGHGWGRGWNYYRPYWGYPYGPYPYGAVPYGAYPYPVAPAVPVAPAKTSSK